MTEKQALLAAIANMSDKVYLVKDSQLDDPTPDTEWTVRDLLNHVVGEALWIPDMLMGKTIEEVGDRYAGDVLGNNAKAAWHGAAALAEVAIQGLDDPGMQVHLSYGDLPARTYMKHLILDFTIHAWDLATAIDVNDEIPSKLVTIAWGILEIESEKWRNAGAFGAAVTVSEDAPLQTKLLAVSGRER